MNEVEAYLQAREQQYVDELLDLLRIPSVSSLSEHKADVQRGAEWVARRLRRAGMEAVEVMPTAGHPVVYGQWLHAGPELPTVLIYGHFDVQPVDPVDQWTHPPFEPHVEAGRVYARGASDDKGNMLPPILALEALLAVEKKLPVNVKCLFEGQEEVGSPDLPEFIAANSTLLACDLAVSADAGQWSEDQPFILLGLRGGCALQIDIKGPSSDLHSGLHGGSIQNPLHALVRLLDSMRSPDGQILVEGFFDDVIPLSEADRAHIAAIPHDDSEYLAELGVPATFGEPGYTTLERQWVRPTLEINGIWGGFQGEGVKTVIPSTAHAKLTCRLVPDQEPEKITDVVRRHVESSGALPPGVTASVQPGSFGAMPYFAPHDHLGNVAVRDVLVEMYGKEPYHVWCGGSIPVFGIFLEHLGVRTVSFGFALMDEGFHAPDEFFRLESFKKGQIGYCKLLKRLADTHR